MGQNPNGSKESILIFFQQSCKAIKTPRSPPPVTPVEIKELN